MPIPLGIGHVELSGTVGVMADSHGEADAIESGIETLLARGCTRILHLGDICDSGKPLTVDRCVGILSRNGVVSLKGNNDYIVLINNAGKGHSPIPAPALEYLKALPCLLISGTAAFTHSLPFVKEMGASSMARGLEGEGVRYIFYATPHSVLFRGHSHTPEVFHLRDGRVVRRALKAGRPFTLDVSARYVVTCGALSEGYCLVWDKNSSSVELCAIGR